MQIWELTIHWKSGLKSRGLFSTEAFAREAYKLATQGLTHSECPPYEVNSRYVHQQADRVALSEH